jgi:hypothetical protein
MNLRVGDVVRKRRGGGVRKAKVLGLTRTHATLETLAPGEMKRRCAVKTWTVARDEDGLPEGYEVLT